MCTRPCGDGTEEVLYLYLKVPPETSNSTTSLVDYAMQYACMYGARKKTIAHMQPASLRARLRNLIFQK